MVGAILKESGFEPGRDFDLCYCPERVLPGNTVAELVNNDRIVGGFTPEAARRSEALYARFTQGKIALTDDMTAELCKLMENTYRDVNIALANELASVCESLDVDVHRAIDIANRHPRVDILRPGIGVGGHCIAIDPWFIAEADPESSVIIQGATERAVLLRGLTAGKGARERDHGAGLQARRLVTDVRRLDDSILPAADAHRGAGGRGTDDL